MKKPQPGLWKLFEIPAGGSEKTPSFFRQPSRFLSNSCPVAVPAHTHAHNPPRDKQQFPGTGVGLSCPWVESAGFSCPQWKCNLFAQKARSLSSSPASRPLLRASSYLGNRVHQRTASDNRAIQPHCLLLAIYTQRLGSSLESDALFLLFNLGLEQIVRHSSYSLLISVKRRKAYWDLFSLCPE